MGTRDREDLGRRDLDELDGALATSGFFQPPPAGRVLRSDQTYWIVNACVDGRFHFNAFEWPSRRFEALTFPPLVFGWDTTGIVILPVDPPQYAEIGIAAPAPEELSPAAKRFLAFARQTLRTDPEAAELGKEQA